MAILYLLDDSVGILGRTPGDLKSLSGSLEDTQSSVSLQVRDQVMR